MYKGAQPLEAIVKVININYHVESKILERSTDLRGYSYFVHLVRGFIAKGNTLNDAIASAISICIDENILTEFLKEHRQCRRKSECQIFSPFVLRQGKILKAYRA